MTTMTLRRTLLALLAVAVLANALLVIDAMSFGVLVPSVAAEGPDDSPELTQKSGEEGEAEESKHPADGGLSIARDTYQRLVEELSVQKERLDARQNAIVERERQLEVVKAELEAERASIKKRQAALEEKRLEILASGSPSFEKLLKAYEGMDPENAAAALAELYTKDRKVVIDVLLGIKSRQAAQTLDALAATHPAKAASLSLEIWQKDPRRGAK